MPSDARLAPSAVPPLPGRLTAALVSPVGTAALVYVAVTLLLLAWGLALNDGVFCYPLDDTYIHLAVAKRFALGGIWGPTPHGFCSSSSSPLWTLLLAASFRLVGVREWIPLAWNVVASALVIWSVDRMVAVPWPSRRARRWLLGVLVLVAPLPALTLLGMEHILHVLANLWLVWLSARLVTSPPGSTPAFTCAVLGAAAVTLLLRFEAVFVVASVCGLLCWRRRPLPALAIAAAAAIPLVAMGFFSHTQGGFWIPNSILMKGYLGWRGRIDGVAMAFGGRAVDSLFNSITLSLTCPLVAIASLLWFRRGRPEASPSVAQVVGAIVLWSIVLHLQFAGIGLLFRYEAYLVVAGLLAVALLTPCDVPTRVRQWYAQVVRVDWPSRFRPLALAALAAVPLITYGARAVQSAGLTVLSTNDRLLEHVWPARLVNAFYNDATLVVNDVGAMAFLTDARLLDLYGIASSEPVRLFLGARGGPPLASLREWIGRSDARIAVLQTEQSWVATALPAAWVHVADWRIPRNVVYGDRVVGLFARDQEEGRRLTDALARFAPQLPGAIDLELPAGGVRR